MQRVTVCAILFVTVYLFMHISKLSEFIQLDVPSNNLLLILNEFGTLFERLEELEIQYSQALANNFAQQVIRSPYVQSDSHCILFACSPVSFPLQIDLKFCKLIRIFVKSDLRPPWHTTGI